MSQQVINIGTTANDGTGDLLRTAWQKTNENFTEIYAGKCPIAGPGSSQAFAVGNLTVGGASGLTLSGGSSASTGDVDYLIRLQQPYGSAFGNNGTGILLGARSNAYNAYIGSIYVELTDGDTPAGRLLFATRQGGTAPVARMIISPVGNVLVGTTTDDGVNKLQVNGSIYSSGPISGFIKTIINNSVVPTANYQMTVTMPGGDTLLRINVRGSDGITRHVDLTLTT